MIDGPVAMPPAIYLAVKQERAIIEEIAPVEVVAKQCLEWSVKYHFAPPPAGQRFLGCMLQWQDRCKVLRIDREDVRVHELAHCAGWPADHPSRER
jgi:hypothetical protein